MFQKFLLQKKNFSHEWEDVKICYNYSSIRELNFIMAKAGIPTWSEEEIVEEEKTLEPLIREFIINSVSMRLCRQGNDS